MAADKPFDPENEPEFPPTDETGNVDITLVRYFLTLSPRRRLEMVESFARFAEQFGGRASGLHGLYDPTSGTAPASERTAG